MIHKAYYKSREEWLKIRSETPALGGSEIGAVLGLNKYESKYTVWARRKGLLPPKPDTEAMRQGRDLEEYCASRFEDASGKTVQKVNAIITNDMIPHLMASIDRRIVGEEAGLECKTASALNAGAFDGDVFPESYYAQCLCYMAVTGYTTWYLAVLVLGRAFKIYAITRDENFRQPDWCESVTTVPDEEVVSLCSAADEFWKAHMDADVPPEVDGSKSTAAALAEMYEDPEYGTKVDLAPVADAVSALAALRAAEKKLSADILLQENRIKEYMGRAERGECPAGKVAWSLVKRNTFDSKAATKALGEILQPFYKTVEARYFRFTPAKEG